MQNPNKTKQSFKLKNESDKDYSYFVRFLELGSIQELANELKGRTSERNLFYIAKRHDWNNRRNQILGTPSEKVLDEKVIKLIEIQEIELENTIESLHLIETTMKIVLKKLKTKMKVLLEDEESNEDKIIKLAKEINQIISQYNKNSKNLKSKLSEIGLELNEQKKTTKEFEIHNKQLNDIGKAFTDFQKVMKDLKQNNEEVGKILKNPAITAKDKPNQFNHNAMQALNIVGLPDSAVKESRDSVSHAY